MNDLKEKPTKERDTTKAFQEFLKFYDWYTLAGGEIKQEQYDILIKKFEYEDNL